jgi:molecular chaperone HscC
MQALKSHPREEAENRFLMRQAERLYQELPMFARETLTDLLDGFEEAMDLGDKEAMARFREALKEFLDRHDPESQQADDASW